MADETDVERVWALMDKIGFAMLASRDGEEIRARPMAAYVDRKDRRVYFLTDKDSYKEGEIGRDPNVCLAFADAGSQSYVSVSGRAFLSNDREKIKEIWSPAAKAWWNSPDDPAIGLLCVVPKDAQYWDSPGTVASYAKMAAAFFTDARPEVGDNEKVEM